MFMGMKIYLPITINVYNMGSIYMSQNGCGKRTIHINSRHHFIYDYVENLVVMIKFVSTEDNMEDPFTKNNWNVLYRKHTDEFMYR